MSHLPWSTFKN